MWRNIAKEIYYFTLTWKQNLRGCFERGHLLGSYRRKTFLRPVHTCMQAMPHFVCDSYSGVWKRLLTPVFLFISHKQNLECNIFTYVYSITYAKIRFACDMSHLVNHPLYILEDVYIGPTGRAGPTKRDTAYTIWNRLNDVYAIFKTFTRQDFAW